MVTPLFIVSFIVLALNWASPGLAAGVPRGAPVAATLNGSYYGTHSAHYSQDFFFGIPFVQPPIGQLRYRAPQPLNKSWVGTRNATEIGYECIGYGVCLLILGAPCKF